MISGEDLRTARESADLTQAELGRLLAVTQRTIGNWERGDHPVPRGKERTIRALLADHLGSPAGVGFQAPRLPEASDVELLSEIARRFARVTPAATTQERKAGEPDGDPTATQMPEVGPAEQPTTSAEREAQKVEDAIRDGRLQLAEAEDAEIARADVGESASEVNDAG